MEEYLDPNTTNINPRTGKVYDGHYSVTQMMTYAEHPSDKYPYDPYGVPMPGGKQTPNTKLFNNPYGITQKPMTLTPAYNTLEQDITIRRLEDS